MVSIHAFRRNDTCFVEQGLTYLQAAFEAGRLVNRFRWHAVQAFFLKPEARDESDDQFEQSQKALNDLGEMLYDLQIGEPHDLDLVKQKWFNATLDRHLNQKLRDSNAEYVARRREWIAHQEICSRVLSECLEHIFEQLRRMFLNRLNDHGKMAFRLGEMLDGGIRPQDVHHRLRPEPVYFEDADSHTGGYLLARDVRRDGELLPFDSWLCKLGPKIPKGVDVPPESEWAKCQTAEQRIEFVESLADRINAALVVVPKSAREANYLPSDDVDGPQDPDLLVYQGSRIQLTPQMYNIIKALWWLPRGELLKVTDLPEGTFRVEIVEVETLKIAVRRLNGKLKKTPLHVKTSVNPLGLRLEE